MLRDYKYGKIFRLKSLHIKILVFWRLVIGRNEKSQFHKKITNCDHNFTTQHNFFSSLFYSGDNIDFIYQSLGVTQSKSSQRRRRNVHFKQCSIQYENQGDTFYASYERIIRNRGNLFIPSLEDPSEIKTYSIITADASSVKR